jgi:hypothetical protein
MKTHWNDYGESSLTIVSVLLGIGKETPSIPQDPSDFNRCIHLFKCLNYNKYEIFRTIEKVAQHYSIWIPIRDNWDKLIELYNEEYSLKDAPKLYTLLQKCRKHDLNEKEQKA